MTSRASSTRRPRPSVGRPVAFQSGPRVLPIPNAGSRRPSLRKSMVAHCLARRSGSRSPTDATFIPNLMRRVAPASIAIALMHSRMGRRDTIRSVCHRESTPPSSHRSTHRRNAAPEENGSSMRPRPTPIVIANLLRSPGNARQHPGRTACSESGFDRRTRRGPSLPAPRPNPFETGPPAGVGGLHAARAQALAEGRAPTRSRHAAMFFNAGSRGCPNGTKVSRFA